MTDAKTPRTDQFGMTPTNKKDSELIAEWGKFARQLETELSALQSENAKLTAIWRSGEMSEYRIFKDGDSWCATRPDFVNVQESLCAFGETPLIALGEFILEEKEVEILRRTSIRNWLCLNCNTQFSRRWEGDSAPCPYCKAGAQFTKENDNSGVPNG